MTVKQQIALAYLNATSNEYKLKAVEKGDPNIITEVLRDVEVDTLLQDLRATRLQLLLTWTALSI